MRRILLALSLIVLDEPSAWAEAALAHGQLADGREVFFDSYNSPTAAEAVQSALTACNQQAFNCVIETQFNSQCLVFAFMNNGGWAYRSGKDLHDASWAVMDQCHAWNQGCHVTMQFCDTVNEQQLTAQKELAQRQYDEFSQAWKACMTANIDACQNALQYSGASTKDRITLREQEQLIRDNASRQLQEAQQQAVVGAAKQTERQRLEAEQVKIAAEEQRIANQQIDERVAADRARDLAAEQRKQADFQKAAIENKHRADVAAMFKACFNGDLVICDAAEQMPLSQQERTDLAGIRQSLTGKSASTQ